MTENPYIDHDLLARIDRFLEAEHMTPTAFGRRVANDSMLVPQIREGRELRRATRAKIEAFIAKHSVQRKRGKAA